MTRIGFVGLGSMGTAIARRLLDAGHDLVVWNRSPAAAASLVAAGARLAADPREVLAEQIVLSMLANDEAMESVFTDEALGAASAGSLHVALATVGVDCAGRLARLHAAHGVGYLAAPVLGRPDVAAAGRLNILAGGSAADVDRVEDLLLAFGKRVWRVGDTPESANLVKIGVNFTLIHALQALAESVTLVERGGVDPAMFVDILTDTAFTGSVYTGYGAAIASRSYPPAFPVALGLKDLALAEAAASASGVVLPTAPALREVFEATLADPDLASLDWSAIAETVRARAGTSDA